MDNQDKKVSSFLGGFFRASALDSIKRSAEQGCFGPPIQLEKHEKPHPMEAEHSKNQPF